MRLIQTALLSSVAFAIAAPAMAADLSRAPITKAPVMAPVAAFSWTGFYIGANVGWGRSEDSDSGFQNCVAPGTVTTVATLFSAPGPCSTGFVNTAVNGNNVVRNFGLQSEGIFGGGQVGFNWQTGALVFGVEADFQGSDISDDVTVLLPGNLVGVPSTSTASSSLDWFGTLRGRLGFAAWDRALLYVTGGLAYGRTNDSASILFNPITSGSFAGSHRERQTGWTVGGGLEWAFTNNLSLKAEYLFIDLEDTDVRLTTTNTTFPTDFIDYSFRHQYHTARVGLNYRFNAAGPISAAY